MTVTIYAGSLAGYYATARDATDRGALLGRLGRWFEDLQVSLDEHLSAPISLVLDGQDQDRGRQLPSRSQDALRLLAAYAECSDLDWPTDMPRALSEDPAWQRVSAEDFSRCHFPQIQIPNFWVAGDFAFTARQAMPDGDEWLLGSLDGLLDQLAVLNQKTLQHTAEDLIQHLQTELDADCCDFLMLAEHALASVFEAAGHAQAVGGMLVIRGA